MENIETAITLIKDFVSILIPVITGFIALFIGFLEKIYHPGEHKNNPMIMVLLGVTVLFFVFSIAACFGTMRIIINASLGGYHRVFYLFVKNPQELIIWAEEFLFIAAMLFFFGVGCALWVVSIIFFSKEKENLISTQ